MNHFVSASCGGENCSICRKPATHKVGEEIMHDEPCMLCGETWRHDRDQPDWAGPPPDKCRSLFHLGFQQRHNLTAYVCCEHFTMILGPATGCPIQP